MGGQILHSRTATSDSRAQQENLEILKMIQHHNFYTEKRADQWAEIWFGSNYKGK